MRSTIRQFDHMAMQLVSPKYPVWEDMLIVKNLCSAGGAANETATSFTDVSGEALRTEKENLSIWSYDGAVRSSDRWRNH
jgi:hypothetical protein